VKAMDDGLPARKDWPRPNDHGCPPPACEHYVRDPEASNYGLPVQVCCGECAQHFLRRAAEAMREACARECEALRESEEQLLAALGQEPDPDHASISGAEGARSACARDAAVIRAIDVDEVLRRLGKKVDG
jgi:hypothetical protein